MTQNSEEETFRNGYSNRPFQSLEALIAHLSKDWKLLDLVCSRGQVKVAVIYRMTPIQGIDGVLLHEQAAESCRMIASARMNRMRPIMVQSHVIPHGAELGANTRAITITATHDASPSR